jgi:hypothetical protein
LNIWGIKGQSQTGKALLILLKVYYNMLYGSGCASARGGTQHGTFRKAKENIIGFSNLKHWINKTNC